MRSEKKQERHRAITTAAFALLAEHGYEGTSMLSIAKAAKASNETLYRWYGDKRGLFEAMVRDNAEESRQLLGSAKEEGVTPIETLRRVAPVLLSMLLGERAILLNRVAAGDASGALGATLSAQGRDIIAPLITRVLAGIDAQQHADLFLSLLIGDQQIKRVTGVMAAPDDLAIAARCDWAIEMFERALRA